MNWTIDELLPVLAVVLVAMALVAFARLRWAYPPAARGFRVLGRREQVVVRAAAEAFFPAEGPIPRSGPAAGCVLWLDSYLARCLPRQRRLVLWLLWLNEYAPLLVGPTRSRFGRLEAGDRRRYLLRATGHRFYLVRVAVLALRGLMTMGYFADEVALQHIGVVADTDPFGLGDGPSLADDPVPPPKVSAERLRAGMRIDGAVLDDVG